MKDAPQGDMGDQQMTTILTDQGAAEVAGARADGDGLWLPAGDLEAATGWAMKPEGLCRGPICVPVPAQNAAAYVTDGAVNMAAFWRRLDKPVLASDDGDVWVLGEGPAERAAALESLDAPDFSLTDLEGRVHTLSHHRGKKVLLATWASW